MQINVLIAAVLKVLHKQQEVEPFSKISKFGVFSEVRKRISLSSCIQNLTDAVFSKDIQTVVVGVTEDCNCMLGGWEFQAVLKKTESGEFYIKLVKLIL